MIKVIIADENKSDINLMKLYFDKISEFDIIREFNNDNDLYEYLKDNTADLIILEISMRKINGIKFVEKLRKENNFIDVIFVTTLNNTDTVKSALRYGAIDYIVKPFSFERFLCTMQNYKVRYNILNNKKSVNQFEIDKILSSPIDTNFNSLLPKGISQITLNSVIEVIEKYEKEFTVEELLKYIDMSRVSLRNYLRFLQEEGIVSSRIIRGSVGRPQYIYKIIRE